MVKEGKHKKKKTHKYKSRSHRRVSEVIPISSIRRFQVKNRVNPHYSGSLSDIVGYRSSDTPTLSHQSSFPRLSLDNDFLHPRTNSLPTRRSVSGSITKDLLPPRQTGITPTQSGRKLFVDQRYSLDQAVEVSTIVKTVEDLFGAVRKLFNPKYHTQFLSKSDLSENFEGNLSNSPDTILTLGEELEEELEEMAHKAEEGYRSSIASPFSDSVDSSTIVTVVKQQPIGLREPRRVPLTSATSTIESDGLIRMAAVSGRLSPEDGKGVKNGVKNSPKGYLSLPSYAELFVRNQQFDCRYQPVQPIMTENFASTFCNAFAYLGAALLVALPVYLVLLLVLPVAGVVRIFQRLFCFEISGIQRMSALESGFMYGLFAADAICTSLVVLETKDVLDPIGRLKEAILTEIVDKRERILGGESQLPSHAQFPRVYKRFRQMPVRLFCDMNGWEDDPRFSVDRHFRPLSSLQFQSVAELERVLSELSTQSLPDDRPPWQIRYVLNFGGPDSVLLIVRHHLALADGVSLVNVLHAAFAKNGRAPALGGFDEWPPMHHLFTGSTYDFNVVRSTLVGPITVLTAHGVEPHPLNRTGVADPQDLATTNMGKFEMILSDPMNLDCCTVIKQITHVSLNEIFLSLLAGSIRCYLQHHAIPNPPDLKAMLPVNVSRLSYPDGVVPRLVGNPNDFGGSSLVEFCPRLHNKYSFAFFKLPVSTEGAVSRLWAVHKRYETFSNASDTASLDMGLKVADVIAAPGTFRAFTKQLFGSAFCLVSNLAGSPSQLTMGGSKVSAIMFWMPPPKGCNLSFSLFTYRNEVRLGVMAHSALVPRPKILTSEFTRQLQQLYEQMAVRTLSMEYDTLFPDFTLSAMTQSTIQELEHLLKPIQTQLVQLKSQIDNGDRSLVTLQQVRRLQDRFRCLLIKIKQQQAIRNESASATSNLQPLLGKSRSPKSPKQALDSSSGPLRRQQRQSSSALFSLPGGNPNSQKITRKTQTIGTSKPRWIYSPEDDQPRSVLSTGSNESRQLTGNSTESVV